MRALPQRHTASASSRVCRRSRYSARWRPCARTLTDNVCRYQEQIGKTERLKDDLMKAISKNAGEIAAFKNTISAVLDELSLAAESN